MTRADTVWLLATFGTTLQGIGSVLTLWNLLSATKGVGERLWALISSLWRSKSARLAANASTLSTVNRVAILQGLAVLTLGYLLALGSLLLSGD